MLWSLFWKSLLAKVSIWMKISICKSINKNENVYLQKYQYEWKFLLAKVSIWMKISISKSINMNEWPVAEYLKANRHKCFQVHAGNLFVCISFLPKLDLVFLCFLFCTAWLARWTGFGQFVICHLFHFSKFYIFIFCLFIFLYFIFVFLYFFVFFLLSRLADQVDWLWSVCGSAIARYHHSQ